MNLAVDVIIEDQRWAEVCDPDALAQTAVEAVLSSIETGWTGELEISFLFCDDAKIKGLNSTWNKKNSATNVLSFPASPNGKQCPVILLGDVVIAFDTISNEARSQSKAVSSHAAHMLVHGVLHLFGFDHLNDEDADEMETLETCILNAMGIDDPWAIQNKSGHLI
jgi:probable rRNA maturation factor